MTLQLAAGSDVQVYGRPAHGKLFVMIALLVHMLEKASDGMEKSDLFREMMDSITANESDKNHIEISL